MHVYHLKRLHWHIDDLAPLAVTIVGVRVARASDTAPTICDLARTFGSCWCGRRRKRWCRRFRRPRRRGGQERWRRRTGRWIGHRRRQGGRGGRGCPAQLPAHACLAVV
eukprot:scaffold281636_cov35-Tisochrysis_lutea.AAC.7